MKTCRISTLLIFSLALFACAPVYHDTTYRSTFEHGHNHTDSRSGYGGQISYNQRTHYVPVEVTVYARQMRSYRPVQLIFYDNDIVEVPVRNRKGQLKKVYAHYYNSVLHFDRDRHCNKLHGSKKYKQNKRWVKGQYYDEIYLGKDYDLSDYQFKVRHIEKDKLNPKSAHTIKRTKKIIRVVNDDNESTKTVVISKQLGHEGSNTTKSKRHIKEHRRNGSGQLIARTDTGKSHKRQFKRERTKLIADRIESAQSSKTQRSYKEGSQQGPVTNKVKISLSGGSLVVDGKKNNFKKTTLELAEGEARKVVLRNKKGLEHPMRISYRKGVVAVKGAGRFTEEKSWKKGKSYKINTEGDSRLKSVKLRIVSL